MATVTVTTAGETAAADYTIPNPGTVRPSGPGYVRYEDLYQPGDTVTAAMARLSTPAIITFPEGVFSCDDFATGYYTGISIPKNCKGIWGSGKGVLGDLSQGTIFTMGAHTSTKAGIIPAQDNSTPCPVTLMMSSGGTYAQSYGQFQVAGTDQGHIYHLFTVYNPGGPCDFTDILVTGWLGNNGAPPGETFGLTVHGSYNHTLTRIEADGRRLPTETVGYGAVGITLQNTAGGTSTDCYIHHIQQSGFVAFQSFNHKTYNLRIGDGTVGTTNQKGQSINHERTAGWEHHNPTILTGNTQHGLHITHSNDTYTLTVNGVNYTTVNGNLKVFNPVFNDIWGDGYFYIQTFVPYWTGNTMTQDNPPLVTKADGVTHLPYKWVYATTHYTIT
jgi:hypothetical protein